VVYDSLAGRVALVTGGARGIGAAIAERLAAEGVRLAVLDVLEPESLPASALFQRTDVTEPAEVEAAIAATTQKFGGLDILVNNAGVLSGRRPFVESSKEELLRYLTVNAVGYVLAAQGARQSDAQRSASVTAASRASKSSEQGPRARPAAP
jgi:NAD(P)-dependent dehydrogenase (short-subunit alcohol dehydrogenase family)